MVGFTGANLCPLSGCHKCEGFNGKVCSGERHSKGKLAQTKYHRKMNSAELGAQSSLIWCAETESKIKRIQRVGALHIQR